jgi:hypothetical protein
MTPSNTAIVTGSSGKEWNRAGNKFCDHVSQAKYHVRKIEE